MIRKTILALVAALVPISCGLGVGEEPDCLTSDDCGAHALCRLERCVPASRGDAATAAHITTSDPPPVKPTPVHDTPDAGAPDPAGADAPDAAGDMEPPRPPCGRSPEPGEIALNELLVNVPAGEQGDANEDGERDPYHDEFIELVNATSETLELTDVTVANGDRVKFTTPKLCLDPGEALVIFGGPKGVALEQTEYGVRAVADSRFGFSNTAGVVRVLGRHGRVLIGLAYEDPPESSYQLEPEVIGDHYVVHPSPNSSPGTCASGASLELGCVD